VIINPWETLAHLPWCGIDIFASNEARK